MTQLKLAYGTSDQKIEIPSSCNVQTATLHHYNAVEDAHVEIERALDNPISSEPLQDIVSGKKKVAIVVEDLTRPTQVTSWVLPVLLERLRKVAIEKRQLKVVVAVGAHEGQMLDILDAKVGLGLLTSLDATMHNCLDKNQLTFLGTTTYATPVWVNSIVAESEVKIGIGNIRPHVWDGYTGGGKIILPGVSSWESIGHNHFLAINEKSGLGVLQGNPVRDDTDQCARKAGLSFVVNTVMNERGNLVKAFAGDLVKAHRRGATLSRRIYETQLKDNADILVWACGPNDATLWDCFNSAILMKQAEQVLKRNGTIILLAECSQGLNRKNDGHFHYDGTSSDSEMLRILSSGAAPEEILSEAKRYKISYPELAAKGYLLAKLAEEKNVYIATGLDAKYVGWLGRKVSSAQEALDKALEQEGRDAKIAILSQESLSGAFFAKKS